MLLLILFLIFQNYPLTHTPRFLLGHKGGQSPPILVSLYNTITFTRLLILLLAIYDANDNLKQRFTYVNDRMPFSMTQDNKKYYLHYDQVGSLRTVTDISHNIIKEVSYDTFGTILTDSNPSFNIPFGFAGGLYDTDTKLTRFGYRDYDAYIGKWTAKDPIGFAGGDSNLYGYVLGDPVGFVDPTGLSIFDWWSEETTDSISDDALKDAFCGAKGSPVKCDMVRDTFEELCIHPDSPCYLSWVQYWGSCRLGTLKCDDEKGVCQINE